jgi:hypothetical protein
MPFQLGILYLAWVFQSLNGDEFWVITPRFSKNLDESTLTNNNITLEDADDIQSVDA